MREGRERDLNCLRSRGMGGGRRRRRAEQNANTPGLPRCGHSGGSRHRRLGDAILPDNAGHAACHAMYRRQE